MKTNNTPVHSCQGDYATRCNMCLIEYLASGKCSVLLALSVSIGNIFPTGLEVQQEAQLVWLPPSPPPPAREDTIASSVLVVKVKVIPRLPVCNTENTKASINTAHCLSSIGKQFKPSSFLLPFCSAFSH